MVIIQSLKCIKISKKRKRITQRWKKSKRKLKKKK